ncbi:MAG TPA: flagellar export chaperone FliS [Steroidobacteraceae bacterium]|nr:flagellar export chaperone FliS [Steroidobacteraceae bacterium]
MYNFGRSGIAAYRDTRADAALGASPHELVQMLLDGALERLASAKGQIGRGETAAKAANLSRAYAIVEALRLALDRDRGGEIARNLEDLYQYVLLRITEANLHNDVRRLDEAASLLTEIRSAWAAIAPGRGATTAPSAA